MIVLAPILIVTVRFQSSPVTLKYQWYRSGVAIIGATAATRVLTGLDLGATLTVRATGAKTCYTTTQTSAPTTKIVR